MAAAETVSAGSILASIQAHARLTPNKTFICVEIAGRECVVRFAEAWADISACAAIIQAAARHDGGVVLVFLPQGWECIAYYFGAMLSGAIPSFMPNPSAKQDPEAYWRSHKSLMERIRPSAIVTDATQAATMAANGLLEGEVAIILAGPRAPAEVSVTTELDQIALLQHSSGTTGAKKGVMLSHRAVLAQIESYAASIGATGDDVIASWLPLYHDMGLVACLLMPAVLGQTVILLDPFLWVGRPGALLRAIAVHRANFCWLPNFAFEHLVRTVRPDYESMSLVSMKAFINCSEPCQADTFNRFHAAFAVLGLKAEMLQVCYAMAETTFAATQHRLDTPNRVLCVSKAALVDQEHAIAATSDEVSLTLLSAGAPIAGVEIEVRNSHGMTLPDGAVGEICLRAPFLFDGYFRLPEQTAERLANGWYRTRDRGFMDRGEAFVLGRLDDLLILNGRNFHAAEIEALVNAVTGLRPGRNVAFCTFSSTKGTNDLVVVAELDTPDVAAHTQLALRHAVREALFDGIGIYPAEVVLVAPGWLVKTSSGKIARGANVDKHQRAKALAKGDIL